MACTSFTGHANPKIRFSCRHQTKSIRGKTEGATFYPRMADTTFEFLSVPVYAALKISVHHPGNWYGHAHHGEGQLIISVADVAASGQLILHNRRLDGVPRGKVSFRLLWQEWNSDGETIRRKEDDDRNEEGSDNEDGAFHRTETLLGRNTPGAVNSFDLGDLDDSAPAPVFEEDVE